ncbi:MAG: glycolate oxidase subunit GlcE [Pseudomonadales bacterium]
MMEHDQTAHLQQQVIEAVTAKQKLRIRGGDSKRFLCDAGEGSPLNMTTHCGVVDYNPTEMVITARAGTRLTEIKHVLQGQGQMLPSESPTFGGSATLGGTVAARVCGSRSPFAGSLRDIVLGCKMINGKGEVLSFGGQVLKNVAGYDVSRLLVGSYGILGAILEVSMKVLPRPAAEITIALEKKSLQHALELSNKLIGNALPLSAACYHDGRLLVRISGNERTINVVCEEIGGDTVDNDFWSQLSNLKLPFFAGETQPLWRLNLPAMTSTLPLGGKWFIDWNGAQRWYRGYEPADRIRSLCQTAGGHATLIKGGGKEADIFQPLDSGLMLWHQQLKAAFDPHRVFNANLMYADL